MLARRHLSYTHRSPTHQRTEIGRPLSNLIANAKCNILQNLDPITQSLQPRIISLLQLLSQSRLLSPSTPRLARRRRRIVVLLCIEARC